MSHRSEELCHAGARFKFRNEHASFKANSAKVSINQSALQELLPAIRTKVRAYQADYVSSIKDI